MQTKKEKNCTITSTQSVPRFLFQLKYNVPCLSTLFCAYLEFRGAANVGHPLARRRIVVLQELSVFNNLADAISEVEAVDRAVVDILAVSRGRRGQRKQRDGCVCGVRELHIAQIEQFKQKEKKKKKRSPAYAYWCVRTCVIAKRNDNPLFVSSLLSASAVSNSAVSNSAVSNSAVSNSTQQAQPFDELDVDGSPARVPRQPSLSLSEDLLLFTDLFFRDLLSTSISIMDI